MRTDPTSEVRADKSSLGVWAPQHAFACKFLAFVLPGIRAVSVTGTARLPHRTRAMRTSRATLAVLEVATDPALSDLVFELTVRKPPKSRVVAFGRCSWRSSFLEWLGNITPAVAALWADETVLRHQRQKPESEHDLQVRTVTSSQAVALLTTTT